MSTCQDWLNKHTAKFAAKGITSGRLDALLLLAVALKQDKSWILAHSDYKLPIKTQLLLAYWSRQRQRRLPIAYILGRKEFYGYNFIVDKNTLVPRPDTEIVVEEAITLIGNKNFTVIDVGTGSGAIGISIKRHCRSATVFATDISNRALKIAKLNAKRQQQNVNFFQADLLAGCKDQFNIIVANLPYVDNSWDCSPETKFEPALALFAKVGGLELINRLLPQAANHLLGGGYLLLEADPRQHTAITNEAHKHNFKLAKIAGFMISLKLNS